MPRFSRPALLLASASLAASLLVAPGTAYAADTTSNLSSAQMAAALKTVAASTATASGNGWGGIYKVSLAGANGNAKFAVDPTSGRSFFELKFDGETTAGYAVAQKGTYETLATRSELAAVKMMGRPSVKYAFTTNAKLNLTKWVNENQPVPATMLTDDTAHAGTTTVHDDGSTTYSYEYPADALNTYKVGADGVLRSVTTKYPALLDETLSYTYGPQTVPLPAAAHTVNRAVLTKAIAFLDMPAAVKGVATRSAAAAKKAAKGGTVKVANLRKTVRTTAAAHNKSAKTTVVVVKDIKNGVRVSAKNPYTGQTVTYTVKAAGKKVDVKKA